MERYNPEHLYNLGKAIADAKRVKAKENRVDVLRDLVTLNFGLKQLLGHPTIHLSPGTRSSVQGVVDRFDEMWREMVAQSEKPDELIGSYDELTIENLRSALETFETRFLGDCQDMNLFSLPDVQCYDIKKLIENGDALLPKPAQSKIANYGTAKKDLTESAKCYALELWTASGFHIARASESIIQAYFKQCNGGKLPTKGAQKTWVSLGRTLKDQNLGDTKLVENIIYVGEHFRNPLIHPEHSLDETAAPLLLAARLGLMTKILAALP